MKESKIGRAWNNKLNRVGDLIGWMYDQDILTQTDKNSKDRIFHSYYRFYNDGDTPRGMSRFSDADIKEQLEMKINIFMAKTLKKYQGKYSRTAFRKAQLREKLECLIDHAERFECHSLFTYFAPKYRINGMSTYNFLNLNRVHEEYDSLQCEVDKLIEVTNWGEINSWNHPTGKIISCQLEALGEQNALTEEVSELVLQLKVELVTIAAQIKKQILLKRL